MALFHPAHSEEAALAPNLWLRTRALEAWLNDKARQGWSLAAMDGHDALLVQDGARARYRAVLVRRQRGVNFDAAAADLLARRRAEGWSFLGACDGVHIFVDREGRAADFADADTAPTARRLAAGRAALAALPWLLLAAYFVIMRFSADGHGLLSGSPTLILPILLLCAVVAAGAWLVRARRALKAEGKRGEAALSAAPRWRRALLVALCYIALLVVASVSPLLPDLLPDLWRGAPLTEAEVQHLMQARGLIESQTAVACTGCRYCVSHCPRRIAIPEVFRFYNEICRYPGDDWKIRPAYLRLTHTAGGAEKCVGCKSCEAHCPQRIPIPQVMKQAAEKLAL